MTRIESNKHLLLSQRAYAKAIAETKIGTSQTIRGMILSINNAIKLSDEPLAIHNYKNALKILSEYLLKLVNNITLLSFTLSCSDKKVHLESVDYFTGLDKSYQSARKTACFSWRI